MTEETLSRAMQDACNIMGESLLGTDHFIRTAMLWLADHAEHFRVEFGGDSWVVRGKLWITSEATLVKALVSAVRIVGGKL